MADRLEPGIVLDVIRAEKPGTVQQLVNCIRDRITVPESDIVAMIHAMASSGALKVKQSVRTWEPTWLRPLLEAHPFLKSLLLHFKTETVFKAFSFVIVCNLISWVILLGFQSSVALAPFRFVFHGINLLFLPGYTITISWYPFPSALLDFSRLGRKSDVREGRVAANDSRTRELDPLTRVTYSVCFSIGLVVLAGFLIGIGGLGFNVTIMHGLFTGLEWLVVIDVVIKIQKLRDPYLHI